ncbi:MAG: putative porin [Ferruginibacter sp.]
MKCIVSVLIFLLLHQFAEAQVPPPQKTVGKKTTPTSTTAPNTDVVAAKAQRPDSIGFEHRVPDTINISYKYLDSVRNNTIDSSVNDFDKYFSVPSSWQVLGNNGAAAYPLIYSPNSKAGWDAGFHAYDVYRYTLEETRFYKTSKPFTQLSYQLASGKEQMVKVLHTQNPKPNFNFGFDYRLINAPGFFTSQNTNHNSYRFFSGYQGKRKRYAASMILVGNTIKSNENGGLQNDSSLSDPNKKDRFYIDVNLGNSTQGFSNPFNTKVNTGNIYKDMTFFLRNSYDIGIKDSVAVNDSTTEYLFYPKLRLQHTLTYSTYDYNYRDVNTDSAIYQKWYGLTLHAPKDTIDIRDKWKVFSNDISLLQFPETKNPAQFFLAGIRLENITGELKNGSTHLYNAVLHAEYRNKTRDKRWDILAKGEFYTAGFNAGDYTAQATLARFINKKLGNVRLFFNNINRTPSFIFNDASSFNFKNSTLSKKENTVSFGAQSDNSLLTLGFKDHFITNLSYFTNYYQTAQYSKVINLLQLYASKKIKLSRKWNLYSDIVLQQTDGSAPVKVPLVFTRNRIAFEGVYYKNLNLSTGIELRYYTPFDAYNYSPVMGQFTPQDTMKIKNLPDIALFMHFRIKTFTGFLRLENLNTVNFSNGFGFTNNNFAAPHYPTQGMLFRFGIKWNFIN